MAAYETVDGLEQAIRMEFNGVLKEVGDELVEELQNDIMTEYYAQYDPDVYERTYQLYTAPRARLIGISQLEVYMFDSYQYPSVLDSYPVPASYVQEQASEGLRGGKLGWGANTDGRYWDVFMNDLNANLIGKIKAYAVKRGFDVR